MLLNIFLFGIIFITGCLLISKSQTNPNPVLLTGQSYQLTSLLEDAPETSLQGQFYAFAIPILCLLEDAPETSLKGQFYPLATPLMTPLACILAQTWHKFYQQHLQQLGINYWQWKDKPEVNNICPELSLLLKLPSPQGYAQQVLESIAQNNNPWITNLSTLNPILQARMRLAFKDWHDQLIRLIGIERLKLIYKICYGTKWSMIHRIINVCEEETVNENTIPWWQVLGVPSSATDKQVEIAYKRLIKQWHPDLNQDTQATEITAQINVAYSEYKLFFQSQSLRDSPLDTVNLLLKVFLQIFKPLVSR